MSIDFEDFRSTKTIKGIVLTNENMVEVAALIEGVRAIKNGPGFYSLMTKSGQLFAGQAISEDGEMINHDWAVPWSQERADAMAEDDE